ncbi:unnamed protein product [Rotaria magnacalcarata]
MNFTVNQSLILTSNCSLKERVYTPSYLFFKLLNATYLRFLVGPGVILNILCLFILSRPRLSNKSTTILFLRFLAVFDISAIVLKFVRAEINYQSNEKDYTIFLLTPITCKAIYVLMNASISISMWMIVLMSLDKAVAVSYPLKASIWLTHTRAFYACWITIVVLVLANLSFINISTVFVSRATQREICGLVGQRVAVDLLTASILPMVLIIAANVVITVVLHRTSYNWSTSNDFNKRTSDSSVLNHQISAAAFRQRCSGGSVLATVDIVLANKRRTNAQVTRMLLAVTLSLIACNIPNTLFSIMVKFYDIRLILFGRTCLSVSDHEIALYKFGFHSGILQDILSDLPHIFNFFLYCLAGKRFRNIFLAEMREILAGIHWLKPQNRRFTQATCALHTNLTPTLDSNSCEARVLLNTIPSKGRKSMEVLMNNGGKTRSTLCQEKDIFKKKQSL